jgi:hypothetical protein
VIPRFGKVLSLSGSNYAAKAGPACGSAAHYEIAAWNRSRRPKSQSTRRANFEGARSCWHFVTEPIKVTKARGVGELRRAVVPLWFCPLLRLPQRHNDTTQIPEEMKPRMRVGLVCPPMLCRIPIRVYVSARKKRGL